MATKTVLVVEDSVTQALSLRIFLESKGLNVLIADDGSKGLQMAREHCPDAIILDVEMPKMNGLEVAANVCKEPRTEHIPIILFTAHDDAVTLKKGFMLGAVDFIPKDVFANAVLEETLYQLGILDRKEQQTKSFINET